MDLHSLVKDIRSWAVELGFDEIGIADVDLSSVSADYREWLRCRFHGEMDYMEQNVEKRLSPDVLLPGTIRVIAVRMRYASYAPRSTGDQSEAYISNYARGRDYHKVVRRRLARIARKISEVAGGNHRAFTDSAPVLEKPIAQKAGLGWVGKNTLILHPDAGSCFFLGEIYTDLPLPTTSEPVQDQCGSCIACINSCPTGAIVGDGRIDARKCISYLTIELKGTIPMELRPQVGNRIFGCDDCQLVCPWNRTTPEPHESDFAPRDVLTERPIKELLEWSEEDFLRNTEGMALRRLNYSQWVRNLAVAAGNAPYDLLLVSGLGSKRMEMLARDDSICVEHIDWALDRQVKANDDSRRCRK